MTSVAATLLSANVAITARNATTFISDSSAYWSAAPAYAADGSFISDSWYAMHGNPSGYTGGQVQNIVTKFIAAKSGTSIPIALGTNGTTGLFYSGCDTSHNFVGGDGAFFTPLLEGLYYSKTSSTAQFSSDAATLKAALLAIPRNGTNHLVTAATPWVPWGFQDGVQFTGDNLMGSLLYWQAATQMAALYTAISDSTNAALFTADAASIVTGLSTLWNSGDGMFHASSGQNNQIDVDGSAYAVYLGVATGPEITAIGSYLVTNVSTLSNDSGLFRQSNTNWATSWGGNQCGRGTGNYDDGYWSIALEWIGTAIAANSTAAATTAIAKFAHGDMGIEYLGATAQGADNNWASPSGAYAFVLANPGLF